MAIEVISPHLWNLAPYEPARTETPENLGSNILVAILVGYVARRRSTAMQEETT